MSCPFKTFIPDHNFLPFVVRSTFSLFWELPVQLLSSCHFSYVTYCLPFHLLHSLWPVCTKFSTPPFLVMCPILILILIINTFLLRFSLKRLYCSHVLSINMSETSISICEGTVQQSLVCQKIDMKWQFSTSFFLLNGVFLYLNILHNLWKISFSVRMRILISGSYFLKIYCRNLVCSNNENAVSA